MKWFSKARRILYYLNEKVDRSTIAIMIILLIIGVSSILADKGSDKSNILALSFFLAHSLILSPRIPFVTPFHIKKRRFF